MTDETQLAKWAGAAVGLLGVVGGAVATLWRLATRHFVHRSELTQALSDQEERFRDVLQEHHRAEQDTFQRLTTAQETMARDFEELSQYLRHVPTRDETERQSQAIQELARSVGRLSGQIERGGNR